MHGYTVYCLWGGFGGPIDQQQLFALGTLDPEVDEAFVACSVDASRALAQQHRQWVDFKPNPLLEARAIELIERAGRVSG